ncbi:MAG: heavy-metal-associated domain-containing protein [Armatimonadota bacterium]
METIVLHSPSISCQGCVRAIETCLRGIDGVKAVSVSIPDKSISVSFDPERTGIDELKVRLSQAGFDT